MKTPLNHRQQLAPGNALTPRIGLANQQQNRFTGTPMPQRPSPRQPLAGLSVNTGGPSGFTGYGMSAGLKVSNPAGPGNGEHGRTVMRPRGWKKMI
jgi:E3 ubiquitin-protein ligase CCNP1IP1